MPVLEPKRTILVAAACFTVGAFTGATSACAQSSKPATQKASKVSKAEVGAVQRGKASWYGGKHHRGPTASGERFNKNALTAAHRKLPFDTKVRVTNLRNNKSVVVRINDRGPFGRKERIIDVSEAAARKLGIIKRGVAPVTVEVLEVGRGKYKRRRRRGS
jgi:rare lipoprotein A